MRTHWVVALSLTLIAISSCSSAPTTGPDAARILLDEVAESMGGWGVLEAISQQEFVSQGNDWEPMQAVEPGTDRLVNGWGRTLLVDYTTEIISGDVGALQITRQEGETEYRRMHPSRFATRLREYNRLAARVLFVAKDSNELTRAEDKTIEEQTIHVLQYQDGINPVELQVDSFTKLPIRVTYTEDDPLYGDTQNELRYLDWRESQVDATETGSPINVRLPHAQALFLNGDLYREEAFRNIINNGSFEAEAFDIPQEIRDTPENGERLVSQWTLRRATLGVGYQGFAQPQNVEFAEVAQGVVHVTGSSHHSMAIEMEDHIILVGTPLFEERSVAVIQALAERFPGKPIRHAVVSHFHMDHSGGVRAYAANGATIIGHESIVPFLTTVLSAPHTYRPDSLEQSDIEAQIEGVTEPMELSDGTRTVQLHHIANEHATGMLVAYLPNERIIFVSDLYSPGRPVTESNANALAFYQGVTAAGLNVSQVVGGHGGIGPYRALSRVMANVDRD